MLSEFEKKVAEFAQVNGLFDTADKILLAVSGGADSMALMYTMCALKRDGAFSGELFCAHINHQLRQGESDLDEDFVVTQATKLNLPITTRRVDVRGFAAANKLSIETAARQLRIESLLDIAGHNNCACIATGHQKNDNAETVLQRLARGTGFRGLAGIWPERIFQGKIRFIRPLLCVTRSEILNHLEKCNLNWRVDHTNADCTYRRNYIRHRLLPALQQDCAGCIVEQLADLSQSARRFHNMVCRRADEVWSDMAYSTGDTAVLKVEDFLPEHPAVKVELIRRSLAAIGSGERSLTHRHYERMCRLADQNGSDKKIELPSRFLVRREYGKLIFSLDRKPHVKRGAKYYLATLEVPGPTQFGDYLIEAHILEAENEKFEASKAKKGDFVECFDLDKLKLPITIRLREDGDRFWPLGLPRQKKVGKFLTDAKVPQEIRRKVLIVADREKIIWVCPIRISEQAKVTDKTGRILQLQIAV
jgi:tRNA(Ile)-lysidine synthase